MRELLCWSNFQAAWIDKWWHEIDHTCPTGSTALGAKHAETEEMLATSRGDGSGGKGGTP